MMYYLELRHIMQRKGRGWNAAKTHCKRGHEFAPENIVWIPLNGKKLGARGCRKCRNMLARERWERNKDEINRRRRERRAMKK